MCIRDRQSILGQCILEKDGLYIAVNNIGDSADKCGSTKRLSLIHI
mgnify:CR=1 FL=1